MQIFTHFSNDDVSTVTMRLSKHEYASLHNFMHMSEEESCIRFPGTRLCYRSMGWYRIEARNAHNTVTKLKTSVAIIKRWFSEYQRANQNDCKLNEIRTKHNMQSIAYVDNGSMCGKYFVQNQNNQEVFALDKFKPADQKSLQTLLNHFNR